MSDIKQKKQKKYFFKNLIKNVKQNYLTLCRSKFSYSQLSNRMLKYEFILYALILIVFGLIIGLVIACVK